MNMQAWWDYVKSKQKEKELIEMLNEVVIEE